MCHNSCNVIVNFQYLVLSYRNKFYIYLIQSFLSSQNPEKKSFSKDAIWFLKARQSKLLEKLNPVKFDSSDNLYILSRSTVFIGLYGFLLRRLFIVFRRKHRLKIHIYLLRVHCCCLSFYVFLDIQGFSYVVCLKLIYSLYFFYLQYLRTQKFQLSRLY